jgi:hypothetical protein
MKNNQNTPIKMTKREFLTSVSAVSGVSAVLTTLNGWDMGIASAAEAHLI